MINDNNFCKTGEMKRSKLRGRTGGMLILVLIIMAVGVILITSAMSITIASRNRYYADAISGQARLTATGAVKTIVAAVATQEIRDDEIEALAANNATLKIYSSSGKKSDAVAGADNTVAPGVGADANAYTEAKFSYFPDATTKKYIIVDVLTELTANGGATSDTEHVRAFLKYNPPTVGTVDAFGAMVTAGGEGSSNQFRNVKVGQGAGAGASSNYVILHGDFLMGVSSVEQYGDVIYTGLVKGSAGVIYSGDIVFYGDKAGITGMGGNGFKTTNGSLLFIGDDPTVASVFRNNDGSKRNNDEGLSGGLRGTKGTYLYNTKFISSKIEGFYPGSGDPWNVFVAGTSTLTDTVGYKADAYGNEDPNITTNDKVINLGPSCTISYIYWAGTGTIGVDAAQSAKFTGAIKDAADKYKSADWAAAAERQVPTTAEAKAMTGYSGGQPAGAVELTASNLTNGGTFTAPAYKVNASGGTKVKGELEFDLTNNDITIYIYNSGTLTFGENGDPGLFKFTNGGAHWGKIILDTGAKLYLAKTNFSAADNGIIATIHTEPRKQADSKFGKPHLYILGLGGNRVDVYQFSQLEGFVGMYGNSTVSPGDSNGTISFHNEAFPYGRYEAITLENPHDDGGGFALLNYCPSPTDPEGGTGKVAITSNYTIEGYEYYS